MVLIQTHGNFAAQLKEHVRMHKAILFTILMVSVSAVVLGQTEQTKALDLSQFQWEKRLLFLFAPNRSHPFFDALQKPLADQQAEVIDRDLLIFAILESGPSKMDDKILDIHAATLLRNKFKVPRGGFNVILIGKDGGIKLSRRDQIQLEEIFALIDSMPMRQREMRHRQKNK